MRRLRFVQIVFLIGWFYVSKLPLETYKDAWSVQTDGPFRTKQDCEEQRDFYKQLADTFGIKVKIGPCVKKHDA